jgi:nucleotidyltransferase AbiEii toxin of type IV toxin-antitoxin system
MPDMKRAQFLDAATLDRAALEMAELAESEHVPAVLVGGTALQFYGSPRFTKDVDFAATGPIPAEKVGYLPFGGFKLISPSRIPVNWIVRDDEYAELYREATVDPLRSEAGVAIARPEYLLAMKMAARHRADLEWMLAAGIADLKSAREIVRRHLGPYAVAKLDRFVNDIEWRKSRGEL